MTKLTILLMLPTALFAETGATRGSAIRRTPTSHSQWRGRGDVPRHRKRRPRNGLEPFAP